ncbi:MAG: hypothetical protein ABSG87_08155 [Verrucomicrobiota bacterium]|jgi:hypothetical protein
MRKKTGVPVIIHLGAEALNLFKDLLAEGVLFPYLSRVQANDRVTEFRSRCRQLGIKSVTLYSYRYDWAERAKTVGYRERFAHPLTANDNPERNRFDPFFWNGEFLRSSPKIQPSVRGRKRKMPAHPYPAPTAECFFHQSATG